jgi:quercetin dioxygenase-like cupin family protein
MRMRHAVTAFFVVCGLGLCGPASWAQGVPGGGTVTELKRADLEGAPGMEVITSRGEYQRGQSIPAHSHHGIETGYVVQGAMVQLPGKEPMMLPTGAPIWNLRDAAHAGFTVVGDTPLILLTVHIVDKGKPVYEYVK